MGSSSRSSQSQRTANNSTQQSFVDNSDNSTTDNSSLDLNIDSSNNSTNDYSSNMDLYSDNSDNSSVDIFEDNSDNSSVDIFEDNSDNSSVDLFTDNTNNSNFEWSNNGVAAGASVGGDMNISMLDGGAIDAAKETTLAAINANTESTYLALEANREANRESLNFGRDALEANERTTANSLMFGGRALDSIERTSENSLLAMLETGRDAVDGVLAASDNIADTASLSILSGENQTSKVIEASNAAQERNAALIRTTALGGQDLMIDLVKKVLLGTAVALSVGATTYMITGRK